MSGAKPTFDELRKALTTAARHRIAEMRAAHPDEDVYVYALYTDDDAGGAIPAASTEQSLQRRIKQLSGKYPFEVGHLRYCPDEWAYSGAGGFSDEWRKVWEMTEAIGESCGLTFDEYKTTHLETMVAALRELDSEGFFGLGTDREAVTLLIWITDSPLAEEWLARSVEQLNPAKVTGRFRKEWPTS